MGNPVNFVRMVALCAALTVFAQAHTAQAGCKNAVVNFIEGWTPPEGAPAEGELALKPPEGARRLTGVFFCEGDRITIPEMTSMHFIEEKNGQVCYQDRTCGNLSAWDVYVGVSGSWRHFRSASEWTAGSDFIQRSTSWNGTTISFNVGVNWGKIERYCRAMSEPICF